MLNVANYLLKKKSHMKCSDYSRISRYQYRKLQLLCLPCTRNLNAFHNYISTMCDD